MNTLRWSEDPTSGALTARLIWPDGTDSGPFAMCHRPWPESPGWVITFFDVETVLVRDTQQEAMEVVTTVARKVKRIDPPGTGEAAAVERSGEPRA